MMKTLADMLPSFSGVVLEVASSHAEIQSRLYALGLYPGVRVDVLRLAPAGDPMQVRCGNTLLSIRKTEASLILVEAPDNITLNRQTLAQDTASKEAIGLASESGMVPASVSVSEAAS